MKRVGKTKHPYGAELEVTKEIVENAGKKNNRKISQDQILFKKKK